MEETLHWSTDLVIQHRNESEKVLFFQNEFLAKRFCFSRTRCIRLIISELGSSFILWDTLVNGASDVRLPKERHITLKSLETGTILALKFDDPTATDEFHQYFVKLSCDPRNADLFDVFNSKRRRPIFLLRKRKIKKSAISKPSHFNHITKVDEHDRDSLYTYSVLVDDGTIPS